MGVARRRRCKNKANQPPRIRLHTEGPTTHELATRQNPRCALNAQRPREAVWRRPSQSRSQYEALGACGVQGCWAKAVRFRSRYCPGPSCYGQKSLRLSCWHTWYEASPTLHSKRMPSADPPISHGSPRRTDSRWPFFALDLGLSIAFQTPTSILASRSNTTMITLYFKNPQTVGVALVVYIETHTYYIYSINAFRERERERERARERERQRQRQLFVVSCIGSPP